MSRGLGDVYKRQTYTLSIEGSGAMADYNAITDDGTVEDDGTAKNYTIKMIPVRGLSTEKKLQRL